ncbi:MAG TPA: tetratricopeptide repeat protein [Bacteroidota bacterium]|nr:tetratricopeptide repeat protein [Bacteroidota bacterium]
MLACAGLSASPALSWGFHFFGFLPPGFLIAAALLVSAACYLAYPRESGSILSASLPSLREKYVILAACGASLLVSILLRIRVPLLGDGFFLVKNFSDAFHGDAPIYYRNEPLATAYFWQFFRITGIPRLYTEFLEKFLTAELILEAGFLLLAYLIIRQISGRGPVRLAGFLLVIVMPYMQLFFGYVETYAVVLFALALYLYTAILHIRGRVPFWTIVLSFYLLVLTHYLALILLPSILYAGYRDYRSRGWKDIALGSGAAALITLLILIAIGFDPEPYSEYVPYHHYLWFTPRPLTPDAVSDPYTLFSLPHFADLANYLYLMGGGFFLLFFAGLRRNSGNGRPDAAIRNFLALAIIPAVAVLMVIKFDLGAARDWDVFSPFFLLLPLFATAYLDASDLPASLPLAAVTIAVLLCHSGSYWLVNSRPDAMLSRVESLVATAPLSQDARYNASLSLAQYFHQAGADTGAIRVWNRYAGVHPGDRRSYQNLLNNFLRQSPTPREQIDRVYQNWLRAIPADTGAVLGYRNYCVESGNVCFSRGVNDSAELYYRRSLSIDSTYPVAYNNLGSVLALRGDTADARRYYMTAIDLNPSYGDALYNLASLLEDRGDPAAIGYYRQAADLNVAAAREKLSRLRSLPRQK